MSFVRYLICHLSLSNALILLSESLHLIKCVDESERNYANVILRREWSVNALDLRLYTHGHKGAEGKLVTKYGEPMHWTPRLSTHFGNEAVPAFEEADHAGHDQSDPAPCLSEGCAVAQS